MNKVDRVDAVIAGRVPDRTPVSFWYHFGPEHMTGRRAIEAHIEHVESYDLDFLKIMNDSPYPYKPSSSGHITEVRDLDGLSILQGDEGGFGRQLEVIGALATHFRGRLRMTTTLFNSWATLRRLLGEESDVHNPPVLEPTVDPRDMAMSQLLREAPAAFARALDVISQSLANFARRCLAAGADGIYLSVRDDWVDTPDNGLNAYDRLVRSGDLEIVAAAQEGTFNMLHVCGKAVTFKRFAEYPVQVMNWADRESGPSIANVAASLRPAICAGVDNLRTMVTGSPDDCAREVLDAIAQAGPRPIMVSPGCTFDPHGVSRENLLAIRHAVDAQVTA